MFGFTKTRDLSFLILPAVILILIFNYLPMLGIVLAFKNYKYNLGIFGSPFAGFDNFKYFFTSQDAWRVTRNTVGYNVVFIITVIAGAVAIAILLNEVRKAVLVKAYQTVFFFPYFLSWPVVAILLYALLNTDLGIVNNIIKMCGGAPVDWYFTAGKWVYIMPLLNFWKSVGYNVIVFYAGLIAIDPTYYESARIDGAGNWVMTRKITLPLLSPLITVLFLLMLGKMFYSDFGQFYIATKDTGTLYSTTDVIDTYVYRTMRVTSNNGMASAAGLFQSALGFITVMASNFIVKLINDDNSLF